ncbi:hypothetical protein [Streptomyces sp. B6B3]|uniref:hypothetical protein n=1 Tax=Streptomyces sp. B6B3 TaxID=3153570 RepID=UPI00325D68D7
MTSGAAADEPLLPDPDHPGVIVYTPVRTGDGGYVSFVGGNWPVTLTVACTDDGSVDVTFTQFDVVLADFTVECPADAVGIGAEVIPEEELDFGTIVVAVDASSETIRWQSHLTDPDV